MEIGYLLPELTRLAFEVAFFPLLGVVDTRRLAVKVAPDFSLLGVVDTRRLAVEVAPDFLGFGELEPLKN